MVTALPQRLYATARRTILERPSYGWTTAPREDVLWLALTYLGCSKLSGDYAEFGVWRGDTLATAYRFMTMLGKQFPVIKPMRFHAFDSFEGFPEPHAMDICPIIQQGGRAYSVEQFRALLRRRRIPPEQVRVTKGWFAQTLKPTAASDALIADASLSLAYVDCDLYESTRDVLPYLRRKMKPGGVVVFDNWFLYLGHPLKGEQGACREFMAAHPEVAFVPFARVGWHGRSFLYHVLTPQERQRLQDQKIWL